MRILAFLLFFAAASASAADTARARLDGFARGFKSIAAGFTQSVVDANGKPGKQTTGTFALEAPRQFRWDVTAPYKQLIVADGMHVWIYDPDLEQVTVRSQGVEEAHSPLTVLTDLGQMDHDFAAQETGERDGLTWLRLTPKAKEPEFEFAELGFGEKNLERMLFKDKLGNRTEIRFSDWQRDPKLAPGSFKFTPPKGVDVIGDVRPEAEVHAIKD